MLSLNFTIKDVPFLVIGTKAVTDVYGTHYIVTIKNESDKYEYGDPAKYAEVEYSKLIDLIERQSKVLPFTQK